MLRLITDVTISPEEAVRAYHGVLQAKKIKPKLPLEKDLELTDQSMQYESSGEQRAIVSFNANPLAKASSAAVLQQNKAPSALATGGDGNGDGWPRHGD